MAISPNAIGKTQKEWKFPADVKVDEQLIEAAGSELLAKLLVKRGIRTSAEAASFLDPAQYEPTSPMVFMDMPRAIVRISQAIAQKEKITVYGDYDVDGVTSTSVMLTTLRKLGAEVDFYIPSRTEGYGLNLKAVSVLASKHRTKLIITCDCGISNFSEINFAKSLGVDTIIVDHHSMPEMMPPAVAILHPKQFAEEHPLFNLPGVGVAYKLAEALLIDNGLADEVPKLLDFVTLGMIADMVPLTKENRYLVQVGMPCLIKTERAGLKALLSQAGAREGTDLVGFAIAPRINAVGRLSDASVAVELLTTEDEATASQLANKLQLENSRRQELCEQVFFEADKKASANLANGVDRAIAIYSPGWHHGVVGIVASRLVEKYHCPVFIGELDETEGIVKGSARGVPGIDLFEVLKANAGLALKWGGHKMAAGFSVDAAKADIFCRALVETCNRMLATESLTPTIEIELLVEPEQVDLGLCNTLSKLAPFGMSNKKPVLALKNIICAGSRVLGKDGKHHRLNLRTESGQTFECVHWNSRGFVPEDGQIIDLAFNADINNYNGQDRLQLVLCDWRDPNKPFVPARPVVAAAATASEPKRAAAAPTATPALPTSGGPRPWGEVTEASVEEAVAQLSEELPAVLPAAPEVLSAAKEKAESRIASVVTKWKDLRSHGDRQSLVDAAIKKLGDNVLVFGESCPRLPNVTLADRTMLSEAEHLLIWHYPPSMQVFKGILAKTSAKSVYLVGGAPEDSDEPAEFLKKLLAVVRFAVNQKEGQAVPDKMAAVLGATKVSVALGLTIFKKINLVDWFAEDGTVYLDLLGQPTAKAEQQPEFRQLANSLKEISTFRDWCATASFEAIQLALVPNSLRSLDSQEDGEQQQPGDNTHRTNESYDESNQLPSHN